MNEITYCKLLTANDVGQTKSHQAGIHIPKGNPDLLTFLPKLDGKTLNPSVWLKCQDQNGEIWNFRFVYYNNKFHSESGRRNEYRITHMTKFLKANATTVGDTFSISNLSTNNFYTIRIEHKEEYNNVTNNIVVRLKGWSRLH